MPYNTELLPLPTIADITQEHLSARGIHLLGVDVENVLTNAGELPIFPWARSALSNLQSNAERQLVLLSNASNLPFVEEVSAATGLPFVARDKDRGVRNKMFPDMYLEAGRRFRVDPEQIGMVDDQLKNYLGAYRAGIRLYVWTEAVGYIEKRGVKVSAIAEKTILRPAVNYLKGTGQNHITEINNWQA